MHSTFSMSPASSGRDASPARTLWPRRLVWPDARGGCAEGSPAPGCLRPPLVLERVVRLAPLVAGDHAAHDHEAALGADLVAHDAAQQHLERRLLGVTEGAVVHHAVPGDVVAEGWRLTLAGADDLVDLLARERAGIGVFLAHHPGAALQIELDHVEQHVVVGHLEGDALVLAERLAERGALGGVFAADLERLLGCLLYT